MRFIIPDLHEFYDEYAVEKISMKFARAEVCLESHILAQLDLFTPLFEGLSQLVKSTVGNISG